ncbi:uncharacterized protein PG986_013776 [Apiospora aurea]|uniref:Uncharacterized protein n=1 Tax=Apiospora aurea TaxID=335848 RepID=A0ABR1PWV2_9PEZI
MPASAAAGREAFLSRSTIRSRVFLYLDLLLANLPSIPSIFGRRRGGRPPADDDWYDFRSKLWFPVTLMFQGGSARYGWQDHRAGAFPLSRHTATPSNAEPTPELRRPISASAVAHDGIVLYMVRFATGGGLFVGRRRVPPPPKRREKGPSMNLLNLRPFPTLAEALLEAALEAPHPACIATLTAAWRVKENNSRRPFILALPTPPSPNVGSGAGRTGSVQVWLSHRHANI